MLKDVALVRSYVFRFLEAVGAVEALVEAAEALSHLFAGRVEEIVGSLGVAFCEFNKLDAFKLRHSFT